MQTHSVLYRRLPSVVLATLFLLAASLPGTAAPATHPAADPNAGWQEVGAGSASGGGISDNSDHSWVPSLAIAPDGTPYVVWGDYSNGDAGASATTAATRGFLRWPLHRTARSTSLGATTAAETMRSMCGGTSIF